MPLPSALLCRSSGVAVVLGAALDPDGRPSPALARRVARGVALWAEGRVARVLLSGGGAHPQRREAEAMADLARALGVPPHALVLETTSASTRGNARHTLALLAAAGCLPPDGIVLVSDLWHLPRAWLCFAVTARRLWPAAERPAIILAAVPARPQSWSWWRGLAREVPALAADLVRVWSR